jgi:hypothetical protein
LGRTNNEANNCVIIIISGGLCGNEAGASGEDDESEALTSVEHRGESQEELSRNVTPQPRRTLVRILLHHPLIKKKNDSSYPEASPFPCKISHTSSKTWEEPGKSHKLEITDSEHNTSTRYEYILIEIQSQLQIQVQVRIRVQI